jgi:ATP-dependent exoDNAse (exonuclease V) beta subunit
VRFGTLVHTVLRDVAWDAGDEAVRHLAELHGRMLDAPADEVAAAAASVAAALRHPLLARAAAAHRRHREAPFLLRLDDRTMVEGTVDLAFYDAGGSDEGGWTVVDFKTDADVASVEERYRVQVAWYVHAVATLTGLPARGVLLAV